MFTGSLGLFSRTDSLKYFWFQVFRISRVYPLSIEPAASHDYVINLGNTPIVGISSPFFQLAFIVIENCFSFAFLTGCPGIGTIGHFTDPVVQTLHALDTVTTIAL